MFVCFPRHSGNTGEKCYAIAITNSPVRLCEQHWLAEINWTTGYEVNVRRLLLQYNTEIEQKLSKLEAKIDLTVLPHAPALPLLNSLALVPNGMTFL